MILLILLMNINFGNHTLEVFLMFILTLIIFPYCSTINSDHSFILHNFKTTNNII